MHHGPGSRRTDAIPSRRLAALLAGLALGWPAAAGALTEIDLVISGAETEKSFVAVNDGANLDFIDPVTYDLDFDFQAGTVQLQNFFLPSFLNGIGVNFALSQVPTVLDGFITVLPGGLTADLLFPAITLDFVRDFGYEGSLTFDLTTSGTTVPAGCAGRSQNQVISGTPLDLGGSPSQIMLVGSACPQTAFFHGNPQYEATFDEAFRVILRGTVTGMPVAVPEPGTFVLVSSGLLGLLRAGRRREHDAV